MVSWQIWVSNKLPLDSKNVFHFNMTIIQYIQVFLCDIMYFWNHIYRDINIGGDNITQNILSEIASLIYK